MKVSRVHFVYDMNFKEIKEIFTKFTETQISPNQYIYTDINNSYFLTITVKNNITIFTIEDSNLSFPFNELCIENIPFNEITKGIIPDRIYIDFSYNKCIQFNNWKKEVTHLKYKYFKLYKRLKNNILFYSINSNYVFIDYNEFTEELIKAVL